MQYRSICIAIFFATCCTWIQAASPSMPVRQEQLEQTRQEALIRSERRLAPQAVIGTAAVEHPSSTALPGGTSFYIRSVEVEHADKEFSFLAHRAQAGRQMDSTAIQQLVDELNTVLLEKRLCHLPRTPAGTKSAGRCAAPVSPCRTAANGPLQ